MKIGVALLFLLLSFGICARAAIIYTDPPDEFLITGHSPVERALDLDGNGIDDFLLRATIDNFQVVPLFSNRVLTTSPNPPDINTFVIPHTTASTLGSSVSSGTTWTPRIDGAFGPIGGTLMSCHVVGQAYYCIGLWTDQDAYAAVEFQIDDEVFYGWIGLEVRNFNGGWLKDFAYNNVAGESIMAGQIPEPATVAFFTGLSALGGAIYLRRRKNHSPS